MIAHDPLTEVVTTVERPDLIVTVAEWIWSSFWKEHGYALKDVASRVAAANAVVGPPQYFVLLVDGEAMGTAGLIVNDLSSRPELTPWLAAVYVRPESRHRGYARALIRAVEDAARVAGFGCLWLYTSVAEGLYRKAGWQAAERFERHGSPAVLMRRDLGSADLLSSA